MAVEVNQLENCHKRVNPKCDIQRLGEWLAIKLSEGSWYRKLFNVSHKIISCKNTPVYKKYPIIPHRYIEKFLSKHKHYELSAWYSFISNLHSFMELVYSLKRKLVGTNFYWYRYSCTTLMLEHIGTTCISSLNM